MLKALWRNDPAYRESKLGTKAPARWSFREELECLSFFLGNYPALKKTRGFGDPQTERLQEIAQAGYLSEFVVYEIWSRIDRHIMLKLRPKARERVREYIERFVVVKKS